MYLSRDAILGRDKLRDAVAVEVPALGDGAKVLVKPASAGFTLRFRALPDEVRDRDGPALIIAGSACDEAGELLFTADDVEEINALPASAFLAILNAANERNGQTAGTVEALEKNSSTDPTACEPSSLPSGSDGASAS